MIVSWTQVMDAATPSCRHFFVDVPTATEHLAGGMLTDLSLALDTQKDFKPGARALRGLGVRTPYLSRDHCEQLPEGKAQRDSAARKGFHENISTGCPWWH